MEYINRIPPSDARATRAMSDAVGHDHVTRFLERLFVYMGASYQELQTDEDGCIEDDIGESIEGGFIQAMDLTRVISVCLHACDGDYLNIRFRDGQFACRTSFESVVSSPDSAFEVGYQAADEMDLGWLTDEWRDIALWRVDWDDVEWDLLGNVTLFTLEYDDYETRTFDVERADGMSPDEFMDLVLARLDSDAALAVERVFQNQIRRDLCVREVWFTHRGKQTVFITHGRAIARCVRFLLLSI